LGYVPISFLLQHIRQPSREDNILDLVLSNEPGLVTYVEVVDCLSSSDHSMVTMVTWKIQWKCDKKSVERESRNYARFGKTALLGERASMDWDDMLYGDSL